MRSCKMLSLCIIVALALSFCSALAPPRMDRRKAISVAIAGATMETLTPLRPVFSAEEGDAANKPEFDFARRNREGNKKALIRDDFWYMFGRLPPQRLDISTLPPDDPKWNAWGVCSTNESTGNSCVYVSLQLRSTGYSKYGFSVASGSADYTRLGQILASDTVAWDEAASLVVSNDSPPPPAVDALLKMVLLATSLLTSPNYTGPPRDLLVARFYANEAAYATSEVRAAIEARDLDRAVAAWEYGRDSWNSYFAVVNRAIVPKVGEKFTVIA